MPYKNPEDTKEAMRRMRLKRKLAEASKDPLDLNVGMKPVKDVFPSMEDWLEANPDKTATDYIKLKIAWDRETAENERQIEEQDERQFNVTMTLEPLNPKSRGKCIKFRQAYLSFNMPNEDFATQNHNATCEYCGKWLRTYSKNFDLHVDFWHPEPKEDPIDRIKREMGFK